MGYEPDRDRLLFKDTSTGAAGGGGTPVCDGTLPLHEGADKEIPGHPV